MTWRSADKKLSKHYNYEFVVAAFARNMATFLRHVLL